MTSAFRPTGRSESPRTRDLTADLWRLRNPSGKCDLCERIAIPTDRCIHPSDGTVANLCVVCWAFDDDAFYPEPPR